MADINWNTAGLRELVNSAGARQAVHEAAQKVAAVGQSLQQGNLAATSVSVEDVGTQEDVFVGSKKAPIPVSAVVFTGRAWKNDKGDGYVAGTPNSGIDAVKHFGGGK